MSEKQNAEMLELAAELEGCLALPYLGIPGDVKFVAGFAMTAANRDLIVAALRAAAPSPHPRGEPVAYAITDPEFGDYLTWSKAAAESAEHGFQPLYAAPPPAGADAVQLQACPAEGGDWIDIYPSQLEWMAKEGHSVRAVEAPAPHPQEKPTGDQT